MVIENVLQKYIYMCHILYIKHMYNTHPDLALQQLLDRPLLLIVIHILLLDCCPGLILVIYI